MRKIILLTFVTAFIFTACSGSVVLNNSTPKMIFEKPINPIPSAEFVMAVATIEAPIEEEQQMTNEDIELIALLTMAEAEGECEEGQRLVIDTVLNRMDSKHFPDTAYGVIYQKNQFSPIWNGRINRCEIREEICQLVREELKSRTNHDVIFFNAGRYSKYGEPAFRIGNHYFSNYA